MNKEHKTTLAIIFAGWVGLCLACSSGDEKGATTSAPPIPHPTHAAHAPWTDPRAARSFRRAVGMSDGWTTAEIKHDEESYRRQMEEYQRQMDARSQAAAPGGNQ